MPEPSPFRLALHSSTGHYLKMSLLRGAMSVLEKRPDVRLVLQDGMPFTSWEFIHRESPDGVLCTLLDKKDFDSARQYRGKMVNVAEMLDTHPIPSVHVENEECGRIAARHLDSTGLNHFGYVGVTDCLGSEKRMQGFVSQLKSGTDCRIFQLPRHPDDLSDWSRTTRMLVDWIAHLPKPVGLYVFSDVHARAVIEAAHSLHLQIPVDVAVVGTGNYDLDTRISRPPLSSVPLNWNKVAYVATRHLITAMEGGDIPSLTLVPPRPLFIRGSSEHFFSSDRAVAKALQHIHQHYLERLQVDEVARAAGLSRRVLEKRFRRVTNSSVYSFIHATRLRKAKLLLMDTEETVDSVAQLSGFREGRLLTAAMKNATGITPGEFRKSVA